MSSPIGECAKCGYVGPPEPNKAGCPKCGGAWKTAPPVQAFGASEGSADVKITNMIGDVTRVESGIIAFSMVAFGFLLSAISSYNQTNIGLAQIGVSKLCAYIPLGPTILYFALIVILDIGCLSAALFSRIIVSKKSKLKRDLIIVSVFFVLTSLGVFAYVVCGLASAFFYPPC